MQLHDCEEVCELFASGVASMLLCRDIVKARYFYNFYIV